MRPSYISVISFESLVKRIHLICDIFSPRIADFLGMVKKKHFIVDRIDKRATEVGITRPELVAKAKIAKNSFSNWSERGTIPPADVALVIADELLCSVRWLITGVNDKQEEYSIEEKNLITKFRLLDKQDQFEMNTLLEAKTNHVGKETISEIQTSTEKKEA
jgi:hypothetical protein